MGGTRETVPCGDYEVEIVRSRRRRTVGITVRDGRASVAAPYRLPYSRIVAVVAEKERWILDKLAEQRVRMELLRRDFVTGERFSLLGREYPLAVVAGEHRRPSVVLADGRLMVTLPPGAHGDVVRGALTAWYRETAGAELAGRTERFSRLLGASPSRIHVRDFKSRWGSCDARGVIKYNWRIVMAPSPVVDYLVAHELSHLKHPDHSRRFWACVGKLYPGYRRERRWLRENGWRLSF